MWKFVNILLTEQQKISSYPEYLFCLINKHMCAYIWKFETYTLKYLQLGEIADLYITEQ